MAKRRMFAKTIIDSDAFLEMPLSTQALYFHLSMRGDDEGFINNPKKISRMIGSNEDELKVLIAKKFIIAFDSGIIVIKHWKIHNYIRTDRVSETVYTDERDQVMTSENGSYSMLEDGFSQMSVKCQSNVSIGKDSIGEVRLVEDSIDKVSLDFEQFWKVYPKKKAKQTALTAFKKNYKSMPDISNIVEHITYMSMTKDWKKENGQFIPYPATWLNAHGWEDEINLSNKDKYEAIRQAKGLTHTEMYEQGFSNG